MQNYNDPKLRFTERCPFCNDLMPEGNKFCSYKCYINHRNALNQNNKKELLK